MKQRRNEKSKTSNFPKEGVFDEEKKPMCSHNLELLAVHVVPKFIIVLG